MTHTHNERSPQASTEPPRSHKQESDLPGSAPKNVTRIYLAHNSTSRSTLARGTQESCRVGVEGFKSPGMGQSPSIPLSSCSGYSGSPNPSCTLDSGYHMAEGIKVRGQKTTSYLGKDKPPYRKTCVSHTYLRI